VGDCDFANLLSSDAADNTIGSQSTAVIPGKKMGPGGGVQEYCLRWNNHHSTLVSVMDALLQKGTLVDVTLAAEGKSIQVHRLVLCACSNYFQELLSQHWDKQAVVFLKDVKFDQLQALVDYMYRGEVNVSQDQLAAFLNTAEALKIKGLADSDRDRKSEKRILEKANRSLSPSTGTSRQPKQARKASKDDSPPVVAAEKPQLPLLPSLVRIPHITSHEDSNDGGEESPESLNNDNDCHSNENDATENLNVELEDGEHFSMVEPKIEAEQEEVEYSGASGDEEDWSDSEYPSQIDASQGKFPTSASGTYSANDIFSITEWTKQGGKHGTTIYLQIKTDISSPDTLISTVAMQIIQLED